MRMFLACLAILAAAECSPLAAQEKPGKARVVGVSEGQLFSAHLRVDWGTKTGKEFDLHNPGVKELSFPTVLDAGVHTLHAIHMRLGFPQPVVYRLTRGEEHIWASEPTVDPRRVEVRDGDVLTVFVQRPYEPYNGKFGSVRGVPVALIFARPYWYQSVGKGEFSGKERFPNSTFFLIHEDWGPEKVMNRVAEYAVEKLNDPAHTSGDFRPEVHASCLIALNHDGKIPKVLRDLAPKDLQKELKAELTRMFTAWNNEKCYRTFPADDVKALKQRQWLPKDFPEGPADISVQDGLRYAEPLMRQWIESNKK